MNDWNEQKDCAQIAAQSKMTHSQESLSQNSAGSQDQSIEMPPRFSQEQYDQICRMLEQNQGSSFSANALNLSGKCGALLVSTEPQE